MVMCSVKVPYQDHVTRLRAARERELASVAREVEPKDAVGFEVGQLFRCAAVERLGDDVRDAFLRINVGEGATVGRPTERNAEGRRKIKRLERLAAFERGDGDAHRGVFVTVEISDQLAVGRDGRV